MDNIIKRDVIIIGAGTAGLYALSEVKRAGRSFALVDQGPLGTTCARVGCMPSKVLLQSAHEWHSRHKFLDQGIYGSDQLSLDTTALMTYLRRMRDQFAQGAINNTHQSAQESLFLGRAELLGPTKVAVKGEDGTVILEGKSLIIAVGSRPIVPKFLTSLGGKMVTTDQFFELSSLPQKIGILGLGAIGLEMGVALSRLGREVIGVDMADQIGGISDPKLAEHAYKLFSEEFTLWLGEPATAALTKSGKGVQLKAGERTTEVDLLLVALGRRSNSDQLNLEELKLPLDERGIPFYNPNTMQVGDYPLFIAGDVNGDRTLMHEAAAEGAAAGYNAAYYEQGVTAFERKCALGIAFTNPDIISVGARYQQLVEEIKAGEVITGVALGKGNGRSRIIDGADSRLHLYADRSSGHLLGAEMVGRGGEHIAHLIALAIERGDTVFELLSAPYYHPVVEELLQSGLQMLARELGGASTPLGLRLKNLN